MAKEDMYMADNKILSNEEMSMLHSQNLDQISMLHPPSAIIIKAFVEELRKNDKSTFLRLYDAVSDSVKVKFELIKGDRNLVYRYARAFSISISGENTLIVK